MKNSKGELCALLRIHLTPYSNRRGSKKPSTTKKNASPVFGCARVPALCTLEEFQKAAVDLLFSSIVSHKVEG